MMAPFPFIVGDLLTTSPSGRSGHLGWAELRPPEARAAPGPADPGAHGADDDVPRGHPRVADRRCEPLAETLLERPQQRRPHDVEVLGPHPVTHVAGTQA